MRLIIKELLMILALSGTQGKLPLGYFKCPQVLRFQIRVNPRLILYLR